MSLQLDFYSKNWNLENVNFLVSTFTSDLYLAESNYGKVVLKILNDVGVIDEIAGTYFLKNCQGLGAVKLFEHDEKALLIEYLPGKNLYQFSKTQNEHQASKIFVDIIQKLHRLKTINHQEKFKPFKELLVSLNQKHHLKEVNELLEMGKHKAIDLLLTQEKEILLHGDLHHENIMAKENGSFVCFDAKGIIGDPSYELGTTLKNPWDYPEISQNIAIFQERAKYFSKELNLSYERIIGFAFVHLCLSLSWAIEDNQSYEHAFELAKKLKQVIKL